MSRSQHGGLLAACLLVALLSAALMGGCLQPIQSQRAQSAPAPAASTELQIPPPRRNIAEGPGSATPVGSYPLSSCIVTDLGTLGGNSSRAYGINGGGQ